MITVSQARLKGYKIHTQQSFTDIEAAKTEALKLRNGGCLACVAFKQVSTVPKVIEYFICSKPYKNS